jgi:hypothetical protein
VKVGARLVEIDIPAPHVSVELEPDETDKDLPITAMTADGRVANATAKEGEVSLTFGARAAAPAIIGTAKPKPRSTAPRR